MIKKFEKENALLWIVTILIVVLIFCVSSVALEPGFGKGISIKAILYHLGIFFFLGFFLLISLARRKLKFLLFLAGILLAMLYGILDEIHQYFVSGRFCSLVDVGWNSIGVLFAGLVYFIFVLGKGK